MHISPVTPAYRAPAARPQAAPAAAPVVRNVQAADGPPPEYSLWSILKDLGNRIGSWFKGLFGRV